MKQTIKTVLKKDLVLAYQMDYFKGLKSILEISNITGVAYQYTCQLLGDSMLYFKEATEKEQINNEALLKVLQSHSEVREILPPDLYSLKDTVGRK